METDREDQESPVEDVEPDAIERLATEDVVEAESHDSVEEFVDPQVLDEETSAPRKRGGLKAWVGSRAKKAVSKIYESRADDIEERARRAVGSAYKDSAHDIEERALRAMRQAIHAESELIKEVIEHSVVVKKREVRLSLLVLVVASAVYLGLYWFTHRGGGAE